MKPLYVIVPLALTAAFALAYPYLQDRDSLEVQRRALVARAESYDPRNEIPGEARYGPPRGPIPDERTALAVAESVWTEIYGAKGIALQRPYLAQVAKGRWHVQGTLPRSAVGGVAYVILAQDDGRIIKIWHEK